MIAGDSPQLKINIVDTGVGMTPDQQSKIFESFSQADETTTRKFGGTGLGLSISRQLTEALGGQLTVSSELGGGSTFTVTLPLAPTHLDTLITPDEILLARDRSKSGVNGETIRLPNKPILVVDDGEANRRLIELVITRAGGQVAIAENGLQAIEKVAEQEYDLIFMDMQMPIVDGYTATNRLRQAGIKTPIIALTGNAMKGDRERCLAAGCDDFLTKPVDIDLLLERTTHFIGRGEPVSADANTATNVANDLSAVPDPSSQAIDSRIGAVTDSLPADPIQSTLPMDDPEFCQIVVDFVQRLDSRLDGIENALASADYEHVRSEAHWLKGAGGTVGFPAFTAPAAALEQAARADDGDVAAEILETINQIHRRIFVPEMRTDSFPTSNDDWASNVEHQTQLTSEGNPSEQPSTGPLIFCAMPFEDAELVALVGDFVDRLDMRLMRMGQLCERRRFPELADEAHWLKGSGGTVGYPELAVPAIALENAAKRESVAEALSALQAVIDIRKRLVLPNEVAV